MLKDTIESITIEDAVGILNGGEHAATDYLRRCGGETIENRSVPKGLDLAAEVLKAHGVDDEKVLAWMHEQQDQTLAKAGAEGRAEVTPVP